MIRFTTGDILQARAEALRDKSRIEDIRSGLVALVEDVRRREIRSIAIPPLGSGLGGLNWSQVRPLIENAFAVLPDVDVVVFEPRPAMIP